MLKVSYSEDCGNSPRKLLLRAFNITFVKGDMGPAPLRTAW